MAFCGVGGTREVEVQVLSRIRSYILVIVFLESFILGMVVYQNYIIVN